MEEIIIYTIETLLLLCYIYYLVWEYSAKDVPFYIKTLTYFSWLLTFSIVLILPIDITNVKKLYHSYIRLQESLQRMFKMLLMTLF